MKYGVFFQLCLGLHKRKNGIGGGRGGGITILACLSLFICFLKIGINFVFYSHFFKGISVTPIFGRNALARME